ncbi:mannose-specific lectin [Larimichthys crocea]|nr:mannose-specific lectin-like [Larimichthys crocea]
MHADWLQLGYLMALSRRYCQCCRQDYLNQDQVKTKTRQNMSRNYVSKNDELRRGDYLMSNNGQWKAVFEDDGNLVIYGWKPVWTSETNGSDAIRLCMQADCNLVMYSQCDSPRWQTNSAKPKCNMCRLQLTDDGKLVLYRECDEIWSSASSKGMK